MKLLRIHFETFRSLVDESLKVGYNCIGFVGRNETGKSNILTAIRTLNHEYQSVEKDRSKINNKFPSVSFEFELYPEETAVLVSSAFETWLEENTDLKIADCFKDPSKIITRFIKISEFDGASNNDNFEFDLKFDFKPNLFALKTDAVKPEEEKSFSKKKIIKKEDLADEFKDKYSLLTLESFEDFFKETLEDVFEKDFNELVPKVIYWEYTDKFLIPSDITYDAFLEGDKPHEVSEPLFNIFKISKSLNITNIEELKKSIEKWKTDSSQRRRDSELLNAELNHYVKDIWEDYDQEIVITLEEGKITIHIKDPKSPNRGYYEMQERSQGFKTFISFLLTIAAEDHASSLQNYILVLDEPETHLHPSGIRFMKQELLKLAQANNYVFYATHSIFMIDRKDLPRQVIVKKRHEHTRLTRANRNNLTQESVIYEALGTSTDEFSIASLNVLFEGELDRKICEYYCTKCLNQPRNPLRDFDLLNGGGTSEIEQFFKNKVIPKDSFWVVILDNDSPARNLVPWIEDRFGDTFDNQFLIQPYGDQKDFELEDLLQNNFVQDSFNEAIQKVGLADMPPLTFEETRLFSSCESEFKGRNSITDANWKLIQENFKDLLFQKVLKELDKIEEKPNIPEKDAAFKAVFPKYWGFVDALLTTIREKHTPNN